MSGQWIALDVYFFAKPFPLRLHERFGAAGPMVFIAFLCACKKNDPQGEISFASEYEAAQSMRIEGWPLVDDHGDKWTLDEFWTFTGRMKQTKKTVRGRVWNVKSTQFERWQRTTQRDMAAERQRRWRAKNGRDRRRDNQRDNDCDATVTDIDSDNDIALTRPGAEPPDPATNQRSNGTNPRARGTNPRAKGTNPRAKTAEARREIIPDWQPEPEPADPVDPTAIDTLRAEHGWTKPETTDG